MWSSIDTKGRQVTFTFSQIIQHERKCDASVTLNPCFLVKLLYDMNLNHLKQELMTHLQHDLLKKKHLKAWEV